MQWFNKSFKTLTNKELYQIIQLRIDVFVVEQNCPYSDLDSLDIHPDLIHLFAKKNDTVCAYMRIIPPNIVYDNRSAMGRIVTSKDCRGLGIGHKLVEQGLTIVDNQWPDKICHISAQSHLVNFYNQHGFQVVGEPYLEDEIPHVGMQRPSATLLPNQ